MVKVSVIMGIYNCASTLQEALDSLYAQTFQDFEIILCDDGSKDNTYEVALENQRNHPNIVLLRNDQNLGLNATLNKCLAVVQGEYIARMDGDDISLPTRFEKQVKFLDEHPDLSLVSSAMIMFDEQGEWGQTKMIEFPQVKDFFDHSPFFTHAAVMIKRSVYLEVGGYTVGKRYHRVEDCHLWYKIYAAGYRGGNILEPLYKMRDDRNAVGRRKFQHRINGIYVAIEGFRMLKMPWYNYLYIVKKIVLTTIKGLLPSSISDILRKKKFNSRHS